MARGSSLKGIDLQDCSRKGNPMWKLDELAQQHQKGGIRAKGGNLPREGRFYSGNVLPSNYPIWAESEEGQRVTSKLHLNARGYRDENIRVSGPEGADVLDLRLIMGCTLGKQRGGDCRAGENELAEGVL